MPFAPLKLVMGTMINLHVLTLRIGLAYTFAASLPLACVCEPRPPPAPVAGDDAIYFYLTMIDVVVEVLNECFSVTSGQRGHHILHHDNLYISLRRSYESNIR